MRMTARDLRGLFAIIPTPAKPNAPRYDATDTVDLDETARIVDRLIADGADGLICLGTTGECATLRKDDYERFVACFLDTVNRRVPTFVGTTALGGHEVVDRMRFAEERGADGVLLGMPMWQPLTMDEAIDYYREIAGLFPSTAIMVYANQRAFRFQFVRAFWEAIVREVPTACAAKYSRPAQLADFLDATGGRINFVPNEMNVGKFYEISPETTTACWSTSASMGPAPSKAMIEAVLRADDAAVARMAEAIAWATGPIKPIVNDPDLFALYNIQMEKTRIGAAGFCRPGPMRPPYNHVPPEIAEPARECGRRWAELCRTYDGAFGFSSSPWLEHEPA